MFTTLTLAWLVPPFLSGQSQPLLMLNRDFLGLPSGRKAALAFVLFALYKMVSVNKEEGLLYSRSNATGYSFFPAG